MNNIDSGVGKLISQIFDEAPNYPWTFKMDDLGSTGNNAVTKAYFDRIETTINRDRLTDASDLSIARTLIHEAMHAYMVNYLMNDADNNYNLYQIHFEELYNLYRAAVPGNEDQHEWIANEWIGFITVALKEYGLSKGYMLADEFYASLAWGGLESTDAFINLPYGARQSIRNIILIELTGKDLNGNTQIQQGNDPGC